MSQIHMVSVPVRMTALAGCARDRAWIIRRRADGRETDAGFDEGRALHHLTAETFGPRALQPFRLMVAPGAANATLYAYANSPEAHLIATARETGPPEAAGIFALERLATKAMPDTWGPDRRLAFDLRVRPTVRLKSPLPNPRQPDRPYQPGAELDAFLVEAYRCHPESRPQIVAGDTTPSGMLAAGRTREAVYRDWLAARLAPAVDLCLDTVRLVTFKRTRVAREGHGPEGPDATLRGELIVKDAAGFTALLASGIGRHKAYGYGMLLLRPARPQTREG